MEDKMTKIKNSFSFVTNGFEYHEIGMKSGSEAIVRGYISTEEVDRSNEIVSKEAMNEMLTQIKNGNVKLDVEHSTFVGQNEIPVGRITDAGIDDKGLWIEATLNKSHDKFKSIWNSIKDGFLDAFSIAYKINDYAKEIINGVSITVLKSLELLNVAITGNPVNRGAKMTESFYKSMVYLKDLEENKMPEEMKEEPKVEEPVVEKKEEQPVEKVEEKKDEPVKEEKPVEKAEEPAEKVEEKPAEKVEEPKQEEPKVNPLDTIKSLQKEIAELKAINKEIKSEFETLKKEMNKPVLKSFVQDKNFTESSLTDGVSAKSVLDSIK